MGSFAEKIPRSEDIEKYIRLYRQGKRTRWLRKIGYASSGAVGVGIMTGNFWCISIGILVTVSTWVVHRRIAGRIHAQMQPLEDRGETYVIPDEYVIAATASEAVSNLNIAVTAALRRGGDPFQAIHLYREIIIAYSQGKGALTEMAELRTLAQD